MTYLFSSPNDPVHSYPVKPAGFSIAEGLRTKTQPPICRIEPFLVNPRIMLRDHDGHDGILFDEDVE